MRVFATVGLEAFPFDRFVTAIDSAVAAGLLPVDTCIQFGTSGRVACEGSGTAYLDYPEMIERITEADVVISHAGVGTFLLCRDAGKVPVIVPRRKARHEHVDDHQVEFALAVAELGMALVADPDGALEGRPLAEAIAAHVLVARDCVVAPGVPEDGAAALAAYVAGLLKTSGERRD